jgi:hypothetical protein
MSISNLFSNNFNSYVFYFQSTRPISQLNQVARLNTIFDVMELTNEEEPSHYPMKAVKLLIVRVWN